MPDRLGRQVVVLLVLLTTAGCASAVSGVAGTAPGAGIAVTAGSAGPSSAPSTPDGPSSIVPLTTGETAATLSSPPAVPDPSSSTESTRQPPETQSTGAGSTGAGSTGAGSTGAGSTGAGSTGAGSTGLVPPSGTRVSAAAFAARIGKAAAATTSAAGVAVVDLGIAKENLRFQERLTGGRLSGFAAEIDVVSQGRTVQLGLELVNGIAYLSGPDVLGPLGVSKKWLRVTGSTNPKLASITQSVNQMSSLGGGDQTRAIAAAATDIVDVGPGSIDGTPTEHFWLSIDAAAAQRAMGGSVPGDASALPPIPVEIWLDKADRTVRLGETVKTDSVSVRLQLDATESAYNQPVTIPPIDPADVATG